MGLTVVNGFLQLVEWTADAEKACKRKRSNSCPGSLWADDACPRSPASVWSDASPSVLETLQDLHLGGGHNVDPAVLIARAMQPAATEDSTAAPDDVELGSAELPSVGSVGHRLGLCKPCVFMH